VFRLQPRDKSVLKYVVEKGYITLDGASLTVTAVNDEESEAGGWWEVMLIAYTQERVVMAGKEIGEEVNVEVDMVGKYVEKQVLGYLGEGKGKGGVEGIIEKIVRRVLLEEVVCTRIVYKNIMLRPDLIEVNSKS
jgi:riboflavin synthase